MNSGRRIQKFTFWVEFLGINFLGSAYDKSKIKPMVLFTFTEEFSDLISRQRISCFSISNFSFCTENLALNDFVEFTKYLHSLRRRLSIGFRYFFSSLWLKLECPGTNGRKVYPGLCSLICPYASDIVFRSFKFRYFTLVILLPKVSMRIFRNSTNSFSITKFSNFLYLLLTKRSANLSS